jgi:hypothetical protein
MPRSNPKPTFDLPSNFHTPMRTNISRLVILSVSSVATLVVTSCTGDPSTGGIFWSEPAAQQRLNERQNKLEQVEKKTGSTNRKSAQTQQKIDALQ